jgi:hypothetical protein
MLPLWLNCPGDPASSHPVGNVSVAFSAGSLLTLQVLTNPTYMEDHLGVLDEEVAAGEVPLPQLPTHKQVGATMSSLLSSCCAVVN